MSKFVVVNTVNTSLNREYDFGIHAGGCRDAKKAEGIGCQIYPYDLETPEEVKAAEEAELFNDFGGELGEGEEMGFTFKIFPCCK